MGHATLGLQRPQHAVQSRQHLRGRSDDQAGVAALDLARKAAGVGQFVRCVEVESDLGHGAVRFRPPWLRPVRLAAGLAAGAAGANGACWGMASAWASRECTSRPTGRPVAPLVGPLLYAMPAMSRCAQRMPATNFCKNLAAVIAPPERPAVLPMSAKWLFRPSA